MSTVVGSLRGVGPGSSSEHQEQRRNSKWKVLALAGAFLSEMPFFDHLEELRRRIIKSLIAVAAGVCVCMAYAPSLIRFLKAPAAKYGVEPVGYGSTEIFSLYFHVAVAGGICLASPVILFQISRFIEPALYAHERRYALPFLISTTVFFLLGAVFGYAIATPYIMKMQHDLGLLVGIPWRPGALDYIGLLTATVLAMGAVFEMPPVIYILSRIGLVDAGFLLRNFRYAFLILAIASGVLTPSGDLGPMIAFLAVMTGLYMLSVLVAFVFGKKRRTA